MGEFGAYCLLLLGCERQSRESNPNDRLPDSASELTKVSSFADARRNFKTTLMRQEAENESVPEPPSDLFQTVRFDSPVGKLAAYLSHPPRDGKKHPAIIWVQQH